jgi:hypothetical protein
MFSLIAPMLLACASPAPADTAPLSTACNGHDALCDRPLDEVALPGTHNSIAAEEAGFVRGVNANHVQGLGAQLDAGVRVMLLDVYEEGGERLLCHGPCALGSVPHLDALATLAAFRDAHPRDVVVLIYEDYVTAAALEEDFLTAGLAEHAYAHPAGATWPTLGELADAQTTLIVTTQSAEPPPAWVHPVWDHAWDTPYTWTALDQFDCSLNRGSQDNPLLLVNHWLSLSSGLPDAEQADQTNSFDVLFDHADRCRADPGAFPNFVVVDYFESGDLFRVVDALNELD